LSVIFVLGPNSRNLRDQIALTVRLEIHEPRMFSLSFWILRWLFASSGLTHVFYKEWTSPSPQRFIHDNLTLPSSTPSTVHPPCYAKRLKPLPVFFPFSKLFRQVFFFETLQTPDTETLFSNHEPLILPCLTPLTNPFPLCGLRPFRSPIRTCSTIPFPFLFNYKNLCERAFRNALLKFPKMRRFRCLLSNLTFILFFLLLGFACVNWSSLFPASLRAYSFFNLLLDWLAIFFYSPKPMRWFRWLFGSESASETIFFFFLLHTPCSLWVPVYLW